jgi:hypothetical protein
VLPRSLLLGLAALGVALTATVVPGVFTVDEDYYLATLVALRHGRLTVPGTEGLTPSSELLYFDPMGHSRTVTATPVASTAPPLYAPLALPFSLLGWRGLVALNTLSFLAAAALVFAFARRYATGAATPWLAVGAFALGGYSLEYAQGAWPQMLAVLLCLGAFALAARVRDGASTTLAFAAGLCAGLASGLRYQNVVFAGAVGLGVAIWAPRRWRAGTAYAGGVALPLAASSLLNHARLGFWNPLSKGPGYLSLRGVRSTGGFLLDALRMGWARVVDFSTRPPITSGEHTVYFSRDADSGAYLIDGAIKKAWLQSAPWIVLALLVCALAWTGRAGGDERQRRELKAISLVLLGVLGLFAAAGVQRTDGLCYNQRYLLELVPLVAIAFAWSLDRLPLDRTRLLVGGLAGCVVAVVALRADGPLAAGRDRLLLDLPLLLAALAAVGWLLARRRGRTRVLDLAVGACLAWALLVHLGDDLAASRQRRRSHATMLAAYRQTIPDRSALFTWWGAKDAAGPLQLDRDVVVLDARNDDGETMPALVDELLAAKRRVFVLANGFSRKVLTDALGGRPVREVTGEPMFVVEVVGPGA